MMQREPDYRSIAQSRPPRLSSAIFLFTIIALVLPVVAPDTAHSQAGAPTCPEPPGPTCSGQGNIGPHTPSVTWTTTSRPRSTDFGLSPKGRNWDHYYLTLDSPGAFRVRITWEDIADNFDLIVFTGHIRPVDNGDGFALDRSDRDVGTSEEVVIRDAEAGLYTVRVVYNTVIESGYIGTAAFLGGVIHAEGLGFGPATIVSAHFLGTEPMVTMERPLPDSFEDAIDPDRIFVDWPLTPRGQIGQVSRSLDGGESFRLLFDPDCPERSRPGCLMGGGSDTMTEVDLIDGTLYFTDQAALIGAESLATSTDHGDTFPDNRQFAITSQVTATDRQWIAPVNGVDINVGPRHVKAFLAYHVPFEGQYVHGIDQDGIAIPQPVPQLQQVIQSGHPRVDTSDGAGSGWIYQPYKELGTEGFVVKVATAHGSDYQFPDKWKSTTVTTDLATNFPWLDIDSAGNAYLVWAAEDGAVYYSVSPINEIANHPNEGGRPGTFWTPPVRLTPEGITSSVFAEVVAGGPGRIAITYAGSKDETAAGMPDLAPDAASWHAYAAVVTGAHQKGGPPVVTTGLVSHRTIHKGNICTAGVFCGLELETAEMRAADRSLAEMIDIGVDKNGRIGVVFTDNNNSLPWQDEIEKARPFVHFAKLSSGPSLFEDMGRFDVEPPVELTEKGDATWPNVASAANLSGMDLVGADLSLERDESLDRDEIVARLELEDASPRALQQAFASFRESSSPIHPPERLHYMLRFATDDDIYHLSMDYRAPAGSQTEGMTRFFGGRLDDNDALRVGGSDSLTLVGAAYRDDGVTVEGFIEDDTLVIRADAADFGIADGTEVFSVTGFAMGGPAEEDVAVINPMRTVDATPPFDAVLAVAIPEPPTLSFITEPGLTGQHSDHATFQTSLTDGNGDPIPNATVDFTFVGPIPARPRTSSGITDANGIATTTVELLEAAGSARITASYVDPSGTFEPSTASYDFVIEHEVTILDLEVVRGQGPPRLEATLSDDDVPPSPAGGKMVEMWAADGTKICSGALTDGSGVASCELPPRYRGAHHQFEAAFAGDGYHAGSTASYPA